MINAVQQKLLDKGEKLFVPSNIADIITTPIEFDAFRFWNHAMLLRRQSEAAKLTESSDRITDMEFAGTGLCYPQIVSRCRELRQEVENDKVMRYPQIA